MERFRKVVILKYLQFCIVGGSGMLLDFCLLHFLASPTYLGWNILLSKAIAAEIAMINNFFWNDIWTFRYSDMKYYCKTHRIQRFLKFNLICLTGIALSVLLLYLQVKIFNLNLYLSNFIAIVLVSIWNFWLNSQISWRVKDYSK